MWVAKSVVGLHASRWKLLNKYIFHSCSRYLTMLIILGVKSQKDVVKSYSVYKIYTRKTSKNAFHLPNRLSLACRRKLHKCSLVFKCLNNLVPRYLTEYFIRNKAFHDYGTRRSKDLHPSKPKANMRNRTFKYAGTTHFYSLPAHIKTAPSFSNFKSSLFKHNYS